MLKVAAGAAIALAAAALPPGGVAAAAPQRVASLNLCVDELVLRLLPPERIATTSWLSHDPRVSTMAERARGIPANSGLAEQVAPLAPDLVLAGVYTTRPAVAMLRRLGLRVEEFGVPATLGEVRAQIADLAELLGEPERGAQVIAELDARMAAATPDAGSVRPKAIVLEPNGFTAGRGSLVDAIITGAGFDNLAAELGLETYGRIPLETAVLAGADVLIMDAETTAGTASLATELLRHPALRKLGRRVTVASVPGRLWTCGGPQIADAVARLAAVRRAMDAPGAAHPVEAPR